MRQAADAHTHALAGRIRSRLVATAGAVDGFEARVVAETAVALLQATLDEWVETPDADLAVMYRQAVEKLRRCTTHTSEKPTS